MLHVIESARSKIEAWILFALICLWSFVWDYNHHGDFSRDGRLKFLLAAAGLLAAFRFAKTWHWTVGIFYAYLIGSWLHFCFSEWLLPIGDKVFTFTIPGNEEVATITAVLFLAPLVAQTISRRSFENVILGTTTIHALVGILNLRGIYPILEVTQHVDENLPIGFLGQQTILGPYLAFGFAIGLIRMIDARGWRCRLAFGALAVLNLTIAILAKSSMTYGAIAAGALIILLFYRGILATTIGTVAIVIALLIARRYYDENVFWHSGRMEPWRDALSLYSLRPWFGFGIGSWEPISHIIKEVRKYDFPWTYLHSDPLQGLFELGRIGVAMMAGVGVVVISRFRSAFQRLDREMLTWACGLAVFGADSLANFVLHLVPHGPIFALCIYHVLRSAPGEELSLGAPL